MNQLTFVKRFAEILEPIVDASECCSVQGRPSRRSDLPSESNNRKRKVSLSTCNHSPHITQIDHDHSYAS